MKPISFQSLLCITVTCFSSFYVNAQWVLNRTPESADVLRTAFFKNEFYLLSRGGMYKSPDANHWNPFDLPDATEIEFFDMAASDKSLYLLENIYWTSTIVHRYDGEKTTKFPLPLASPRITLHDSLIFLIPTDAQQLIHYQVDGAASWQTIDRFVGKGITAATASDTALYIATFDSLYYTNDLQQWSRVKLSQAGYRINRMLVVEDSLFLAAYPSGSSAVEMFATGLVPDEWQPFTIFSYPVYNLTAMVYDGITFLIASNLGAHRSDDGGKSWNMIGVGERPSTNSGFNNLLLHNNLLIAGATDGLYKTTLVDNMLERNVSGLFNSSLDLVYADDDEVIVPVDNDGRLYQSKDGGQTWNLGPRTGGTIAAIVTIGDYKFVAYGRGVISYHDQGTQWIQQSATLYDIWTRELAVTSDNHLYAATEEGLYLSTDSARSWTALHTNLGIDQFGSVIVNDTAVFASTAQGVYWSKDEGATWTLLANPSLDVYVSKMIIYDNKLFIGCNCADLVYAYDFTTSQWETISTGISTAANTFLIYDGRLFASSSSGGVSILDGSGKNWSSVNGGLRRPWVRGLAEVNGDLVAAIRGYGLATLSKEFFAAIPVVPQNVSISEITNSSARVSWNPIHNAMQYKILVSTDNFSTTLPSYNNTLALDTTIALQGLTKTTEYQVKVLAENMADTTAYSAVAKFITDDVVPLAPSSVNVHQQSPTKVNVTWIDNSDNETGFIVERCRADINGYIELATLASNTTSFEAVVEAGYTYHFRVSAINAKGNSAFAVSAALVVLPLPQTPTAFTATPTSISSIKLTWGYEGNIPVDKVQIERSVAGSEFALVASIDSVETTYIDNGLVGVIYSYRLTASNVAGKSPSTSAVSVNLDINLPATPSDLTFTELSALSAQLTWTDNSSDEDGFVIERSVGNRNSFKILETVDANTELFIDETYDKEVNHYYRVMAFNLSGTSDFATISNVITNISQGEMPMAVAYPNPAERTLTVTMSDQQQQTIQIISSRGEIVFETVTHSTTNIDVTSLSAGFYILKIINAKEMIHYKVMIKKN